MIQRLSGDETVFSKLIKVRNSKFDTSIPCMDRAQYYNKYIYIIIIIIIIIIILYRLYGQHDVIAQSVIES